MNQTSCDSCMIEQGEVQTCPTCLTTWEATPAGHVVRINPSPPGQSKTRSLVEIVTGLLAGLTISFFLQPIIYCHYGLQIGAAGSLSIALIFTGVSLVRGYIVRRLFNHFR